jgi:uncharacterized protein
VGREDIMSTINAFIKRHPVLSYFTLAFTISWGCTLLVVGGPGGIPSTPEEYERLVPWAIPALLVGPSIAGLLLTGLVSGRAGYRELRSRLLRWRVGAHWYAVALLTAPLVLAGTVFALSLRSPVFLPSIIVTDDKVSLLVFGLIGGLLAGIFEELGWTGFAIPRLRLRYGVLTTGLIVGVLWGAWHILVNLWAANVAAGALPLAIFVPMILADLLLSWMPAFRVLMVWVYDQTGSLLVAMLMHASLTASTIVLGTSATGAVLVAYHFMLAAALWVVVALVAVTRRGQLARRPLQRQVA